MSTVNTSTHTYVDDDRNRSILININGELLPRDEAKVSVFDSAFMLGDGVWEGLRVHNGKIAFLDKHLARLYGGAKALDFHPGISPAELTERLEQ
ncbi:MAG: aminotransferase class IV, partial [Gammaproteobacteria bacterium]|nr:aminotransferase class IV [Gammaproteobacteria bacterium]